MITPINNIHDTIYKTNLNKKGAHFTAHKDFAKIAQNYNIKASCYFRRGTYYGAPAYEFSEVINALKKVFETEGKKEQDNILHLIDTIGTVIFFELRSISH